MADIADILGIGLIIISGSDQGISKPGNFLQITNVPSLLYSINMFNGAATVMYLMVFDLAGVPADGAVPPRLLIPAAAGASISYPARMGGIHFSSGIIAVASTTWGTAAGNITKTISTTASCFFSAEIAPTD